MNLLILYFIFNLLCLLLCIAGSPTYNRQNNIIKLWIYIIMMCIGLPLMILTTAKLIYKDIR